MSSHDAYDHTPYKSPDVSSSFSTKYLLESETGSTSVPGNALTGHIANNSPTASRVVSNDNYWHTKVGGVRSKHLYLPVILSSNFMKHFSPLATTFIRPVQFGSAKFQSAALQVQQLNNEMMASANIYLTTLMDCLGGMLYTNTSCFTSEMDSYSIPTVF